MYEYPKKKKKNLCESSPYGLLEYILRVIIKILFHIFRKVEI